MKLKSLLLAAIAVSTPALAEGGEDRVLLFGDTHLHTRLSGDAYSMGNTTISPDDSYRYAKGYPVLHPASKARVRINKPLDFLVVSDHAEYMGLMNVIDADPDALAKSEIGRWLIDNHRNGKDQQSFVRLGSSLNNNKPIPELYTPEFRRPVWDQIVDAADRNNEPGKFTALIGWEWSSVPNGSNLHRVVLTPDGADKARRMLPFSSLDDNRPEELWKWLSETSKSLGMRFVAIPHNSNLSTGLMFPEIMSDGAPITAEYADARSRWEPVAEILQIKGSSETHPLLAPEDEFAGHEIYEFLIDFTGNAGSASAQKGDFWRHALSRGLEIEGRTGANPYKVGAIGSTDSHTGLSTVEESNFHGKFGYDAIPANKFRAIATAKDRNALRRGVDYAAQGLAAVWADENTRDGLYEAFMRKETYATSGPRIELRFFGGWGFRDRDAKAKDLAAVGYRNGVPMGGDLASAPKGTAPAFLVRAAHDPGSAYLDRIQIIKGWTDASGAAHEKIYNVALADGRKAGPDGSIPPVGSTVNADMATFDNSIGDPELSTVWRDPDFDPAARAYYYARVLEIPTPRHSLYDAVALKTAQPDGTPTSVQERAISSPIWYTP